MLAADWSQFGEDLIDYPIGGLERSLHERTPLHRRLGSGEMQPLHRSKQVWHQAPTANPSSAGIATQRARVGIPIDQARGDGLRNGVATEHLKPIDGLGDAVAFRHRAAELVCAGSGREQHEDADAPVSRRTVY